MKTDDLIEEWVKVAYDANTQIVDFDDFRHGFIAGLKAGQDKAKVQAAMQALMEAQQEVQRLGAEMRRVVREHGGEPEP